MLGRSQNCHVQVLKPQAPQGETFIQATWPQRSWEHSYQWSYPEQGLPTPHVARSPFTFLGIRDVAVVRQGQ